MDAYISLALHFLFIVSIVTLGFGGACALLAQRFLLWSNHFEPHSRLLLLRLFASWPILSGLAVGVMVSLPALNHVSKLPLDHCHNAGACVGPPAAHMLSFGELVMIIVLLSLLSWTVINAFLQWRRANALVDQIDIASHASLAPDIRLIDAAQPLAVSLGLFKSVAVLSTNLVQALTTQQLNIICIHEETHMRHHDNRYKWALRMLCVFHWPRVKQALLDEHAVAMELRADQEVANRIQDPIAVAETIVAVQRLMSPLNTNEPLCQFVGTALERRVHYLLAQSPSCSLPQYFMKFCVLTTLVVIATGAAPLHNALEALLT